MKNNQSTNCVSIDYYDAALRSSKRREDVMAVERMITLSIVGVSDYKVMCSPAELESLIAGFALTEGIISSAAEIKEIRFCETDPAIVYLVLTNPEETQQHREHVILSSCGYCGKEDIDQTLRDMKKVDQKLSVTPAELFRQVDVMQKQQIAFEQTGAISTGSGRSRILHLPG